MTLIHAGAGQCSVAGDLTLATAADLWRELRGSGLLRGDASVDLSQVSECDSAGLALLLAWRASCQANGGDLVVKELPGRLAALAGLTEAQAMLSG